MRVTPFLALAAVGSLFFAACAVASGQTSGGDARLDASTPPAPFIEPPDTGAGPADSGSGTTFSDIYRDLLGPTGVAACAGNGKCHGGADQPGSQATNLKGASGYICAGTKAECRATLLSSGILLSADKLAPEPDFTKSYAYAILRRQVGAEVQGSMPKGSAYVFTKSDLDRIGAWVAAGTPDN